MLYATPILDILSLIWLFGGKDRRIKCKLHDIIAEPDITIANTILVCIHPTNDFNYEKP